MRLFGRDSKDPVAERKEADRIEAIEHERERKLDETQNEMNDTQRRLEALSTELRMLLRAENPNVRTQRDH